MFDRNTKRQCIERELNMRRSVYPHWIRKGKIAPGEANRQIAIMEDILRDYTDPDLFGEKP